MDKPKRRVRYKGTHPKKFQEKYKELNPEKYSQDVDKIISRGATLAGTHRPICVDEILTFLNPRPGDFALDVTLGYGGHSLEILKRLQPGGKLVALDQDPIERPKTEKRIRDLGFDENTFIVGATNFSEAKKFLISAGVNRVDCVLADLGLSSMQIDDPQRGFSLKQDLPLDLRMNPSIGIPARDFIKTLTIESLAKILEENSDELRSTQIAKHIIKHQPRTTHQLAEAVREAISTFSTKVQKEERDLPIRRAFQALRIEINNEFGVLDKLLSDIPALLKPGGRVAILSFHSGEDRRVKKSFQTFHRQGIYKDVAPDPIRASLEEQKQNPRSKPAKLRWAIKS